MEFAHLKKLTSGHGVNIAAYFNFPSIQKNHSYSPYLRQMLKIMQAQE